MSSYDCTYHLFSDIELSLVNGTTNRLNQHVHRGYQSSNASELQLKCSRVPGTAFNPPFYLETEGYCEIVRSSAKLHN